MKKSILLGLSLVLGISTAMGQVRQELSLEAFDKVDLDGHIVLYMEYDQEPGIILEAKKESYIDDYKIGVRNNTLRIHHAGDYHFGSTAKITVYLKHPGISELDMDGLVSVYSKDAVKSEDLRIKGDGLIRGDIEVNVERLDIGLDGLGKMTVAGRAQESNLSVDGMGKIDAQGLQTTQLNTSAEGLSRIKVNR